MCWEVIVHHQSSRRINKTIQSHRFKTKAEAMKFRSKYNKQGYKTEICKISILKGNWIEIFSNKRVLDFRIFYHLCQHGNV